LKGGKGCAPDQSLRSYKLVREGLSNGGSEGKHQK